MPTLAVTVSVRFSSDRRDERFCQSFRDRRCILRVADCVQQHRTGRRRSRDVVDGDVRLRGARHDVVAAQRLAKCCATSRNNSSPATRPSAVIDASEVVEVDVQHGELVLVAVGRLDRFLRYARNRAARQTRQCVVIGDLCDALFDVRPLLAQRERELPDLVRVERLLQVEQLVGRRDAAPDLHGGDIRVRRADHDLDLRVDLADPLGGPGAVGARRHAHVEERDRDRGSRVAGFANRRTAASAPLQTIGSNVPPPADR
jgi:hypothetical protein